MDFSRLGLRNLLGIILPGATVFLALAYLGVSIASALSVSLDWTSVAIAVRDLSGVLPVTAFLLVSYVLGSLIRLRAADKVDTRSAFLYTPRSFFRTLSAVFGWGLPVTDWEATKWLDDKLDQVTGEPTPKWLDVEAMRDLWEKESFPYPVWLFTRLRLYFPIDMYTFFRSYKHCFGKAERRGKEFFNYCKLVVYQANVESRGSLAEEVRSAEAITRFFAGTFYSLLWSSAALFLGALLQLLGGGIHWSRIGLGFTLAAVSLYMARQIVAGGRFRNLRMKEVDLVFDAFFLSQRYSGGVPNGATPPPQELPSEYRERERLVRDAFFADANDTPTSGPVGLDRLVRLMKARSSRSGFLSSVYFAGAQGDHPYFLKTNSVALGIAVLPEDNPKSSQSKQHPHQTEVMFVLDGRLKLETRIAGRTVTKVLTKGDVEVISPGQCHRTTSVDHEDACYLFVKSNPAQEPRERICALEPGDDED